MKLKDFINRIFGVKLKKLTSGNIVESEIIPIKYKYKNDVIIANYIRDEINQNRELYKIFLEEYDEICIGDIETEKNNVFRINHNFDRKQFKGKNESLKKEAIELMDNILNSKYHDRFPDFYMDILKSNIKGNYTFIPINGVKQKDELYYNITQYFENDRLYLNYLSSVNDIDGLKLLIKSKDTREFLEKYNKINALNLLNWELEFYKDHKYNDFFSKNIDIIDEAINNTMYNAKEDIIDTLVGKEKTKDFSNENQSKLDDEHSTNMTKTDIFILSKKILDSFDTSGKLGKSFEEKWMKGGILLFYPEEKNQTADYLSYLWNIEDGKDKLVDHPYYNGTHDLCVIPITCEVTDIPTVIHEFIHQYYYNNTKDENPYSSEIPSIFYEMESIRYLKENGYGHIANILQEQFEDRKRNDSFNNYFVLKTYVRLNKIKRNGEITLENILDDNVKINSNATINDVLNAKNRIAQLDVKLLESIRNETGMDNVRKMISYTIGTLIAERYNESDFVKKEMLELINNPEYSVQKLLNGIGKEKELNAFMKISEEISEREIE